MKRTIYRAWWAGLLVLMLGVNLAACDSQSAAENEADTAAEDVAALTSGLTQDLSLSGTQQQALQGAVDRNRHRMQDPGFLWTVAAALQTTLTDEQKQRLFDLAAQREEAFGGPGFDGPGGFGPGHGGPGDGLGPSCLGDVLTDEQQAALEAIRTQYRSQVEALIEARRNETITPEAFREQMEALRAAMQAEIDALLDDEQRAAVEACREERRAEHEALREERRAQERAAMIAALGLTDAQAAALDALFEQQQAERDALRAQAEAGTLSREALHAALVALKESGDAALQDLLDETQWEIKLIHDALAVRAGHIAGRRGPGGGPGGFGRPGGGGPFGR